MSEPFKSGDRVLVATTLTIVGPRSTKAVRQTIVIDARNAIRLPLDDATVERLARAAHDDYWNVDPNCRWDNEESVDDGNRDEWRSVVRAVISTLTHGAA